MAFTMAVIDCSITFVRRRMVPSHGASLSPLHMLFGFLGIYNIILSMFIVKIFEKIRVETHLVGFKFENYIMYLCSVGNYKIS